MKLKKRKSFLKGNKKLQYKNFINKILNYPMLPLNTLKIANQMKYIKSKKIMRQKLKYKRFKKVAYNIKLKLEILK